VLDGSVIGGSNESLNRSRLTHCSITIVAAAMSPRETQ